MKTKNKGFVVPVAIGILVVASLGLLAMSWWSGGQKVSPKVEPVQNPVSSADTSNVSALSTANDDQTLDADSANVDAQIKNLDSSSADIDSSLNDQSTI